MTKNNRLELFKLIWKILKQKKCHLYRINGVENHLHILVGMQPTMDVANLVKDIKVTSHLWIEEERAFPGFIEWQIGYEAFTVSSKDKDDLIEYIKNQEIHHETETFEEEYVRLLKENDIDFNEQNLFEE